MSRVTNYLAELECFHCGKICAKDDNSMQTYIYQDVKCPPVGIGDRLEIDVSKMRGSNYLAVQTPSDPTRILEEWNCSSCGAYGNWAVVTILHGVIVDIASVPRRRATIRNVHFAYYECKFLATTLANVSPVDVADDQAIDLLLQHLSE